MSDQISSIVESQRRELKAIKAYLVATTAFTKLVGDETTDTYFANSAACLNETDDIKMFVEEQIKKHN